MDTSKSEKILENYWQQEPKYQRRVQQFSGTFDTTPDQIFPLLCPTREADWIPGWSCQLIYTESGYAEDNCVFRTDKSNSVGPGLWTFTGYKLNEYIEFIRFQEDILLHARISLQPNGDGTTTGTWKIITTALTKKGNQIIQKMPKDNDKPSPIISMIGHYLKTGKTISKFSLIKQRLHGH